MEVLHEAPKSSSFVPLAEHQAATPASFYNGPAVLHYYSDRSRVIIPQHELASAPQLQALMRSANTRASDTDGVTEEDEAESEDVKMVAEEVDVWVTSDKLFLFSNASSAGVSIPYPSISLHAIQSSPLPTSSESQCLYMQLISAPDGMQGNEDVDLDTTSVTIIPTASAPPPNASEDNDFAEDQQEQTPVLAMFTALSACSNLHPDPVEGDENDEEGIHGSRLFQAGLVQGGDNSGGMPPAMPGSGGWITAENMHEFVDEDGNWIGGNGEEDEAEETSALGPGAGTTRTRDESEVYENGDHAEDETKWRRTS